MFGRVPGRHEHGVRRQIVLGAAIVEANTARRAVVVHVDTDRCHALGEPDSLLQRFLHFFVVQRVGRAVDQAPAVRNSDAAPVTQHLGNARLTPLCLGLLTFIAYGARVCQEFLGNLAFVVVPGRADRLLPDFALQRFVALQEFFDLHHVVGQRFGGGVDRGEAAADHHDGQSHLHVGDGVGFRRPRQLQRHQEIGSRAHAARKAVGNIQHRRAARADAERDVVEAHPPCVLDGHRAAKAHTAEHRECVASLHQQADQLEEVLVPAHRDAIFSHTAKASHDTRTQRLHQRLHIAHRGKSYSLAIDTDTG